MSASTLTRDPRRQALGAYVGMIIFLGAWGMCFAALFFAYAVVRLKAPMWPPNDVPRLPLLLPALNTGVLLATSVTLHRGLSSVRAGREGALRGWLWLTIAGGLCFLVLQLVVWLQLYRHGLHADEGGLYGSMFYTLTIFHALHVLSGLVALGCIVPSALRGRYTAKRHTPLRMVALFWHFVDAVWVVMFLSVYVL